MNVNEVKEWLGKPVRLRYQQLIGQSDPGTHAEGRLIGFTTEPTVIIETEDGTQISWLARLAERIEEPDPVGDLRKRVEAAVADPQNHGKSISGEVHYVDARAILEALYGDES